MREGSFDQAREIAHQSFAPLASETLPLGQCVGRVSAADLYSLCDLPAYATSSMDGWAVAGSAPWKIVGEVATGKKSEIAISAGQTLRIATGGVIPDGCEAVIPWEEATESGGTILGEVALGANIRPAALESKQGELLIPAGTRLTPPMVGLLAATGHDAIVVTRTIKIAIFFLGDELMHSGVPQGGSIRDALGPQLPALLESLGSEVVIKEFVEDDLQVLITKAQSAVGSVDLIITTGGTADGPRDFVKPTIAALGGEYLIDCARIRPGYHILLAAIPTSTRSIPFMALPGNPQSALAAFYSFGAPVIDSLRAKKSTPLATITLASAQKTPENFSRALPGTVVDGIFTPTEYLNSAMLRGVAFAQGFAVIDPGVHAAGATARFISFTS
jgi:molybdopterin molybdotransferase